MSGGMRNGKKIKAVIPGGSSVPVIKGEVMMNTNLDYESISQAGSMLGSGAIIIMDEDTDMVKVLHRIARFYYSESCGQCSPCREGTGWILKMMNRLSIGDANIGDIDKLSDICSQVENHTICALGDAAAWPVQGLIRHFRDDIEKRILKTSLRKSAE